MKFSACKKRFFLRTQIAVIFGWALCELVLYFYALLWTGEEYSPNYWTLVGMIFGCLIVTVGFRSESFDVYINDNSIKGPAKRFFHSEDSATVDLTSPKLNVLRKKSSIFRATEILLISDDKEKIEISGEWFSTEAIASIAKIIQPVVAYNSE